MGLKVEMVDMTNEQLLKKLLELAADNYTQVEQQEFVDLRAEVLHRMSYYKDIFK